MPCSIDLFQNRTLSSYTNEMNKEQTIPTQPLTESKYQKLSTLKDGPFRRLTGVSRKVFALMVEILTVADAQKKAKAHEWRNEVNRAIEGVKKGKRNVSL